MTAKTKMQKLAKNDDGFVLIGALLILVLLIIIGIASTTNTSLELLIAGNDRVYKETFYRADGGARLAARLIEENIGSNGFTSLNADNTLADPTDPNNTILITTPNFSNNSDMTRDEDSVSDAVRDLAFYPNNYDPANPNTIPRTNIITDGVTITVAGSGLQMLAGYEGKGFGTAGGGGAIAFDIYSQHIGRSNSESIIGIQWRHVIGLELEGRY